MEVIDTTTTESTTSSTIELPNLNEDARREIGDFLIEQILMDVSRRKSPVSGESFPPLSPEYKEEKQDEGMPGVPNLELTGEMLNQLSYRLTETGIEIGVFGDAAPRADGHNNLSGDSTLPLRRFLPDKGETFRPGIQKEVERIAQDYTAQDITLETFQEAVGSPQSASEFYASVGAILGISGQSAIRAAILRNPAIFNYMGLLGLDEFL